MDDSHDSEARRSTQAPDVAPKRDGGDKLPLLAVERAGRTGHEKRRRFRRLPALLAIPLLIALGGMIGLYFQPPGLQAVFRTLGLEPGAGTSTPIAVPVERAANAAPADDHGRSTASPGGLATVVGLGKLMPVGDVATVALPFGAGDARIESIEVRRGERVSRGQMLAVLDSEGQLEAALRAARATLDVREAALAQTRATVQASLDEARADLARAEAAARDAERDHERAVTLAERGTVSPTVVDDREAERDQARRDVDRARATLSRYQAETADAQVDVRVAVQNVNAAQADVERALRDLERAYVRAPIAGTVLDVHVDPGERPGSAGVMDVGAIDRMMAEVEIYESEIGAVAPGDPVELTAGALALPLRGEVSEIGLAVGRQTLIDDDPAAHTDARVVEVEVLLDTEASRRAARLTGLQVTARIAVAGPQ